MSNSSPPKKISVKIAVLMAIFCVAVTLIIVLSVIGSIYGRILKAFRISMIADYYEKEKDKPFNKDPDIPVKKEDVKMPSFQRNIEKYPYTFLHLGAQLLINFDNDIQTERNLSQMIDYVSLKKVGAIWLFSEKTSPCFGLVYYSHEKDALIVVFRCTKTPKEWGYNYKYKQTKFENTNANVHMGFYSIFENIKPQLRAIIKENPSCRILFYGYSLGAAIASLAALSIQNENINTKVFCFCFGKPRVGDPEYCELVNETFSNRFYRLENQEDIAPDLPPAVCANFWNPKSPYIYKHEGNLAQFSIHNSTLGGNHSMETSLQYIKSRLEE